ncbi:sensor domain-containing diguanylate cyclase [Metallibacterium scheffleri]|jgi:diguanylate cyclase (GGDEF)-like protein/PAS domain S-box-containing protein|uniref:sensor domain-containing protein n=2 Tax=Metallibacterium TaxID=1218803 RepID=UPI0026EA1ABD|nr:sensor domain-containing diguanylate cyclase [Metallibacterium scheffleri]MBW8075692.1 diguanylate cyclase [Metallibacterium scheffleri]
MPIPIHARLEHVLDLLVDAVCVVDTGGRFGYVSAACERIFGYTPEEMLGQSMIELVHPDDRARTLATAAAVMSGTPTPYFENRYLRKDGGTVHIMWTARWSEADGVRIAVARDITARKHAEAMQAALLDISEAAHTTADLLALFRRIHEIIGGLLPAQNCFVALHDPATGMLSFPYFIDAYDRAPAPIPLDAGTLTGEVIRSGEALLLAPDRGMHLPAHVRPIGRPALDWLGVPLVARERVLGALVVQSYTGDVRYRESDKQLLQFVSTQVAAAIERKQNETWLRHIAQHDALTALPNRTLFDDRLQAALLRARHSRELLGLLYLDLDHFKHVNDTWGHAAGDALLQDVARRIRRSVRESDTVGRMGGDEFVVLLAGIKQADHAMVAGEKIRTTLLQPFEAGGQRLSVSASIGVAVFPGHGSEGQHLIREADRAMYDAKKRGGNRCVMATVQAPG